MLLYLILVGLQVTPHSYSLSWSSLVSGPYSGVGARNEANLQRTTQDIVFTEEEANAIFFSHNALEKYSGRPDCFRRAAVQIQTRCGELEMDEHERVNAAISMTLCEIGTAKHYSLPLECTVHETASHEGRSQGECVDALSRSAQFWSSYSGYLREVPQLCFAFRRWNDIDSAKDIYKNATMESIALIRSLLAREKESERNMEKRNAHLADMHELVSSLRMANEKIDVFSNQMPSNFDKYVDEALASFRNSVDESFQLWHQNNLNHFNEVQTDLRYTTQQHSAELDLLAASVESTIMNHLETLFAHAFSQTQDLVQTTNNVQKQWEEFGCDVTNVRQVLVELSDTSMQVSIALERSILQADTIFQTQLEALTAASQLTDTIEQLTTTTVDELEKINGSATSIRRSLEFKMQNPSQWRKKLCAWVLQVFFRMDPLLSDYFIGQPAFRILLTFLSFASFLFRITFSATMSLFIFLFFSSRSFLRKYTTSYRLRCPETQVLDYNNDYSKTSPSALPMAQKAYPTPEYSLSRHCLHAGSQQVSRCCSRHSRHRTSRIPDRLYKPPGC